MREDDFAAVIARCRKIIGPVAESLAREAAREAGAKMEGEKIIIASEEQYASIISRYREKMAKIVGAPLAENLVR
ncbi:MAG: hypothetical protein QXG98_03135 [Candidatus Micrarchaeia archaeon]